MKSKSTRFAILAVSTLAISYVHAQSTWTGANNGEWGTASNWNTDPVFPNAIDAVANIDTAVSVNLTDPLSGYTFGTLSSSIATGSVVIGTNAVTTDILTAASSSGAPIINVTNSGGSLYYYANLAGTQGFQKTGAGRLLFRFNNAVQNFQGLVDIQGGGVELQRNESLGDLANDVRIGNAFLTNNSSSSTYANLVLTSGRDIELTNANSRIVTNGTAGTSALNLEIQGLVTGIGSLNKEGANTLTLSGAGSNSFLNTEVRDGILAVSSGSSLGTGTLAVRRGVLNLNHTAQTATGLTLGNAFGAGQSQTVNLATGHTLSFTGNITYNATNNGVATISGPGRLAALTAARVIDVGNGSNATDLTISAVITGSLNFEKRGLGALLMTGGSTTFTAGLNHANGITDYTTSTFTTGGFGMNGQSANTSPIVNIATPFNVNMIGFSDVIVGDQNGTGTATINIATGGSMLITGSAGNQRPFAVANAAGSANSTGIVNLNGGSLTIAANQVDVGIGGNKLRTNLTATGTVNINSGSSFTVLGSPLATNAIYLGTSRLELAGAVPNTGSIQTGSININSGGVFETSRSITRGIENGNTTVGNLTLDGGTLRAGAADNAAWVNGLTQFAMGTAGGTIDTNGRAMGVAKAVTGPGALTKSGLGTLTLSGLNAYSGDTLVNVGTLSIATDDTLSDSAAVRLAASGATLDLTFSGDDAVHSFYIGGVQQASGKWGRTGSIVALGAAHESALITGDGLLNVINGSVSGNFTTWATTNGVTGGPNGDSDNDGISNLVEYALALNPAASDGSPGTFVGSTLTFTKRAEAVTNGDVTYVIEKSTDLGISDPWTAVTPTTNTGTEITYLLPSGPVKNFARFQTTATP
ncbi:MAG: hypothetical protein RLZZ214_1118 [Verrucomicrobiota bacterium]